MEQKRGPHSEFSPLFSQTHARWKGTGNPCSNFLWKYPKISPDRFEKYFQDLYILGPCIEIWYWFDLALNGKDFGIFGAQWGHSKSNFVPFVQNNWLLVGTPSSQPQNSLCQSKQHTDEKKWKHLQKSHALVYKNSVKFQLTNFLILHYIFFRDLKLLQMIKQEIVFFLIYFG